MPPRHPPCLSTLIVVAIIYCCLCSIAQAFFISPSHHHPHHLNLDLSRTRPYIYRKPTTSRHITMVQSLNLQGILAVGQVLRSPSLMLPHVSVPHIGLLDFELLRQAGIKGIIFDKDNTLTAPYVDEVHPQVKAAFEQSKKVFGASRLVILSNSAGTLDDPNYEAATRIERSLGIPVLRHATKKPGAIPEVLEHFKKECGAETTYQDLAIIGDRLLTDVMWGNFAGMFTVHTQILTEVGDNRVAAIVRRVENRVYRGLNWRGYLPAASPVLGKYEEKVKEREEKGKGKGDGGGEGAGAGEGK